MDVVHSPRNLDKVIAATGAYPVVLEDENVMATAGETIVPTTFWLNVEASTQHYNGDNRDG